MDRNELNSMDEGVLTVIVERMQEQRYPRALELKRRSIAAKRSRISISTFSKRCLTTAPA